MSIPSVQYPPLAVSGNVTADITAWNPIPVIGTVTAVVSNPLPVSGTVTALIQNPLPVSGTVTAVVQNPLPISGTVTAVVSNPLPVTLPTVNNAAVSSVTVVTSSIKLLSSNPDRKGLIIYNNSSNSVYLSTATPASSSANLFAIVPTFAQYSFPYINYTGAVYAIRNAGTGNCVMTEFT